MNIFVTSNCPHRNARLLDNKRVVKMVLETAQLLSNCLHHRGEFTPYKISHINHPCSVWVRQSKANYDWLYSYFVALCAEYTRRYNKNHKCSELLPLFNQHLTGGNEDKMTPFANCTGFKDQPTFAAYRMALKKKWANDVLTPRWTTRK